MFSVKIGNNKCPLIWGCLGTSARLDVVPASVCTESVSRATILPTELGEVASPRCAQLHRALRPGPAEASGPQVTQHAARGPRSFRT